MHNWRKDISMMPEHHSYLLSIFLLFVGAGLLARWLIWKQNGKKGRFRLADEPPATRSPIAVLYIIAITAIFILVVFFMLS